MFLSFDEIIKLKKLVQNNFNTKLHVHDTCGGQYFSLDKKFDNIENVINDYLSKQNLHARFSADMLSFTIESLK